MIMTKLNVNEERSDAKFPAKQIYLLFAATCIFSFSVMTKVVAQSSEDLASAYFGEKTLWHGFDRYDFLMDETTLVLKPIKAAEDEGCETSDKMDSFHPVAGQRRCLVVVPKVAAPDNPWIWKGYYFGHQSQAEVELLKRGY